MEAFDVLGDPVRRRILELLAEGERASGEVTEVIRAEFGIGAARGLDAAAGAAGERVRRGAGRGPRRLYAINTGPMAEVDAWLGQFRAFWEQRLDALGTEIARGRSRIGTGDAAVLASDGLRRRLRRSRARHGRVAAALPADVELARGDARRRTASRTPACVLDIPPDAGPVVPGDHAPAAAGLRRPERQPVRAGRQHRRAAGGLRGPAGQGGAARSRGTCRTPDASRSTAG